MQTFTIQDVKKREDILLRIFNKAKYGSEKRTHIINLLTEMRERFGFERKITRSRINATHAQITENGKYSCD